MQFRPPVRLAHLRLPVGRQKLDVRAFEHGRQLLTLFFKTLQRRDELRPRLLQIFRGNRLAVGEKGALKLEAGLADWRRAHGELAKRLDPEAAQRLAIAAEALEEL